MKYDHLIGSQYQRWTEGEYTPGQLDAYHDFTSRFVLLSGSYRSGKSEIGSRWSIRHTMSFPGAKVGVFRQHLASLKKSTLINVLELVHPSWVADWSNTDLVLRLVNGSTITFIGCDFPDRLGSIELTGAFIDEASEVSKESLGMIQGRLSGRLTLVPEWLATIPDEWATYAKATQGFKQVYLACNPKSRSHYLYQDFIKEPKPGHTCYTSNSIANRNLGDDYLVSNLAAYVRSGKSYEWVQDQVAKVRSGELPPDGLHLMPYLTPFGQRNMLGLWVAMEGAIYDLDESRHYLDQVPTEWGTPTEYLASIDWGFQNPRLAVYAHYQTSTYGGSKSRYARVYGWNEKQSEPNDLIRAVDRLDQTYDFTRVYAPPDQPGLIRTLKKTIGGSRVKTAKNAVLPGINTVSRFLNSGDFVILKGGANSGLHWSELSGYQWKPDKSGGFLDEPLKENDHYPDADRYLLHTRHHKDSLAESKPEDDDDDS